MTEGLKASPHYKEKIEKVRTLPREGKNPTEIKEQAKLLRMELMLDNAECARLLIHYIEQNPTATEEEFKAYAVSTGLISQPEVVEDFIDQLKYQKGRVDKAQQEIKHHSKQNRIRKERVIFSWMSELKYELFPKPAGNVELDSNYPLALILYTENPDDFHAIDVRTNVGGFYMSQKGYGRPNHDATTMIHDSFPVIVVKGSNPKDSMLPSTTTEHEKGHAENKAVQEALAITKKRAVWAELPFNYNTIFSAIAPLTDITLPDIERAKKSKDWQILLDSALYLAKDELLAEFKARQGHTEWHQSYMKKRKGLYDYFANRFDIKPESELYKALWQDYEYALDAAQIVIGRLIDGYHTSNFMLRDRIELCRWVLAQIPIKNWPKQIEGTLFYQEIDELKEVSEIIKEEVFAKDHWRNLEDPRVALAHKFLEDILKNQSRPLLPIIKKFKQDLDHLDK